MIDTERLRWMHRTMVAIRMFEDRVSREFRRGDMPGFVHSYAGEEAVAVGVCAHLGVADLIASTHRGHGHCIAKGCSIAGMLAELYGRETGLCRGRGGSMHIADFERGMLGANAIVGGGIALATGGALAAQVKGTGAVSVSFFGDGAANQGVLYESINLAAIWKLPVIYVCENNGWAESTPVSFSMANPDVADRAAAYGIPGVVVDAARVEDVYAVAGEAVHRARAGEGPSLIEAKTYRLEGHFTGDHEGYRDKEEKEALRAFDPIPSFEARLLEAGIISPEDVEAVRKEIETELDDAVAAAKDGPLPDPADVDKYVYAGEAT